jgi:hypothetical protein
MEIVVDIAFFKLPKHCLSNESSIAVEVKVAAPIFATAKRWGEGRV